MDAFFSNVVYGWLQVLFGSNLGDYLAGYNVVTRQFDGTCLFAIIGIITLAISIVTCVVFYYVINHPRFNRWWSWVTVLAFTAVICLIVGASWTLADFNNGNIPDELMCIKDINGGTSYLITSGACWGFGIANAIVSVIFFCVSSLCIKWWSRNSKYAPF